HRQSSHGGCCDDDAGGEGREIIGTLKLLCGNHLESSQNEHSTLGSDNSARKDTISVDIKSQQWFIQLVLASNEQKPATDKCSERSCDDRPRAVRVGELFNA